MAIIIISRGSYTRGREIAERTAQKLSYDCFSREVLLQASKDFNIPEIKLLHAIEDAPSFIDRFTRGRERYIAYSQAALINRLKKDNVVYHGFASYFFVKDLPQVLKVRIISNMEDRINSLMEREKVSGKDALRVIKKIDDQRKRWGLKLYGFDPADPTLYDLVLHIDKITVEDAVTTICQIAGSEQFQTTPQSKRLMEDLALAAEVKTYLMDVKPSAEVCIENGFVSLKTGAPVTEESELVKKMGEIMRMVPGVKGIKLVTEKEPDERYVCLSDPGVEPTKDRTSTFFTEFG